MKYLYAVPEWIWFALGFVVTGLAFAYFTPSASATSDEPSTRSWSLSGELSVYRIRDGNTSCYVTEKAIACVKNP